MKLVIIMRVKNEMEEFTKYKFFESYPYVDHFFIVEGGSSDGTPEFLRKKKNVTLLHSEGYHEGRDQNSALEEAKKSGAKLILMVDADERIDPPLDVDELVNDEIHDSWNLKVYPIDLCPEKGYRVDKKWLHQSSTGEIRLFRNLSHFHYENQVAHAGNIRGIESTRKLNNKLLHYFARTKEELDKKRNLYNNVLPRPGRRFDHYSMEGAEYKKL